MKNYFKKSEKGITLVALVVTIVVLIILATISISLVFNENGILGQADKSKDYQANGEQKEQEILDSYDEHIANAMDGKIPAEPTGPVVTIGGTQVTLTKDNVYQYLGKKVTNYTGQSSVTIGETEYTVSTEYRLYYVDFDDKYKEGAGTIYLKAECTSNNYALPITDTSSADAANIKIKKLNPSLYKTGVTSPTATNNNMKAVTWLTNTNNWSSLADTTMSSNINYIVGAPSLEMFMDSYNTHYASIVGNATEPTASGARSSSSTRTKLFYQYPYNSNNYGYGVGPGKSSAWYTWTDGYYTVQSDTEIDSMYYPGSSKCYWLASPSANDSNDVMIVYSSTGGRVHDGNYGGNDALCPVVSLKSGVQLQLQ